MSTKTFARVRLPCNRSRRSSREQARPGAVVAWQTFGDSLSYHPHLHILMTDGVFMPEGDSYGYLDWDALQLTSLVRDSIVASCTHASRGSPASVSSARRLARPRSPGR
ncbi:MAG: transposase [Armatimonadetes bacterium]|nr:transposase [Armatimonadota bacterium]